MRKSSELIAFISEWIVNFFAEFDENLSKQAKLTFNVCI